MARNKKMKLTKEEELGELAILPEDLVVEILTRLPAKSLLQSKSVCKQLKSIIQEPTFVALHHKRSHTRTEGGSLVISVPMPARCDSDELRLFSATYEGGPACPLLPNRPELNGYKASPSTHGLIILSPKCPYRTNQSVFVFNPTTRELASLPPLANNNVDMEEIVEKIRKENAGNSIRVSVDYCLGFDPSTGMYKVLSICSDIKVVRNQLRIELERIGHCLFYIFTLGTNEWRKLDTPKLPAGEVAHPSCCVNGAIYFKANYRHNTRDFIAALDVGKEKFRLVPPPRARPMYKLMELGGRLALRESNNAVWILEDPKQEKWIRVELDSKTVEWIHADKPYTVVSQVESSNKFLLAPQFQTVAELLWVYYCDKSGKEWSKFQITGLPDVNILPHGFLITNNIETLFSPSTGLLQ